MSSEEEKRCPLCAEEMDWTDLQFKPCRCDYQVCVWCWHQIMDMAEKDATEGRCPACRTPYDKEKIAAMQASCESKVATINSNPKQKPPKAKSKPNEEKKDLTNVRVIQRKMAYVIGLPLSLADEDLLLRKEYFGQYGRVTKISLSRTAGGSIQQFVNDTCSVYITYSKEEEAIRCIQSVHGFVLEGRFLRASFGTAKYCHAWLRNMPCNNPACLYLHSSGAEEDSFGKDEVAAVHTRNRVHQMVGATHNMQQRSGNVLPLSVDEPYSNSGTSTEERTITSEGAVYASAATSDHLTSSLTSEDTDGGIRAPNRMTTFLDIVGRPPSSGPEKDGNFAEERRFLKLSSELAPVTIDTDNHVDAEHSDAILCRVSSSSHIVTGLPKNKELKEPFWEPSNPLVLGRKNLIGDASVQVQHGPYSVVSEDVLSFDNQILKDSDDSTQTACLFPSSYPAKLSEDSSGHAWPHRESSCPRDFDTDHNTVHNCVDEASIQFTRVNSILNDGYNERKFQNSAKSDRIYRGSNSFSNEEIVEHLRRLEDDNTTNDDEISTFDAVESSIISNLLSMDLDDGDDSLTLPHSVAGLFDETDRQYGSSWNFHNSDQSGLSFVKQEGFASQVTNLDSFSNICQVSKKGAVLHDSGENKEHYFCKPQYYVPRAQSLTPPGFSASSRDPPPGFSACERTEHVIRSTSGSHLAKTFLPNNHYRTPSTGSIICNTVDDFSDPAILVVGRGKPTSGLSNSGMDMRPAYTSKSSTFEDETRLWLLMQKSTSAHHDPQFSQIYRQQQTPYSHQELRYSGHIGDGFSHLDDIYGISSRLKDQHQTYNPSSFTQLSQQKIANGHISTCYQPGLNEAQRRNEVVMAELHRNERLRFNDFSPGYGDSMFQMSSSGDVYTRVFGM